MHRIVRTDFSSWSPQVGADESRALAVELELGKVIHLWHLPFTIAADERRYLDPLWLSGTHKSISFDPTRAQVDASLRGARGAPADLVAVASMIGRFRHCATMLVRVLFPAYAADLRPAPTSLRLGDVETYKLSWRKDDTLLHVDAFPSRPNRGERILRVFTNVNPHGAARTWKLGDLFEESAREFLPRVPAPMPGSASLLRFLRLTKSRRSRYDHIMLSIHDRMKQDREYQERASHLVYSFPSGSTWICFSDQTTHAALSGQYLLEQTFHLPLDALYFPERAPLKVLERLSGGRLV